MDKHSSTSTARSETTPPQNGQIQIGGYTMSLIKAGQIAAFEVEGGGGWKRRPAPHDGLLVESNVTTVLLPIDQVAKLVDLHRKEHQQRRQRQLEHTVSR